MPKPAFSDSEKAGFSFGFASPPVPDGELWIKWRSCRFFRLIQF